MQSRQKKSKNIRFTKGKIKKKLNDKKGTDIPSPHLGVHLFSPVLLASISWARLVALKSEVKFKTFVCKII